MLSCFFFFFQAEDGIRDYKVTGVQTCALPIFPVEAQFAPVYASLAADFNGDGHTDLLLAGNFYGVPPVLGRYDASYGLLLSGRGDGRFTAVDMGQSHLVIDGGGRHLGLGRRGGGGPPLRPGRPPRQPPDSCPPP